jgi:hypothetical protein
MKDYVIKQFSHYAAGKDKIYLVFTDKDTVLMFLNKEPTELDIRLPGLSTTPPNFLITRDKWESVVDWFYETKDTEVNPLSKKDKDFNLYQKEVLSIRSNGFGLFEVSLLEEDDIQFVVEIRYTLLHDVVRLIGVLRDMDDPPNVGILFWDNKSVPGTVKISVFE